MVGAAAFFWTRAEPGVGPHLKAVGKAVVWPAFLVYAALEHMASETEEDRSAADDVS